MSSPAKTFAVLPHDDDRAGNRVNRARLVELLEEDATREYQAILRLVRERQCDSLGDFAMAEHLRSVLAGSHGPEAVIAAVRGASPPVSTA
jgi:hypothetical protein